MNAELRSFLEEIIKSKGYGTSDDEIVEHILECGKRVWAGEQDRYRWYSMIPTVVNVNGRFIMYDECDVHGEQASVEDCIGGYELDMFKEVFPKEKTVIVYEEPKGGK